MVEARSFSCAQMLLVKEATVVSVAVRSDDGRDKHPGKKTAEPGKLKQFERINAMAGLGRRLAGKQDSREEESASS